MLKLMRRMEAAGIAQAGAVGSKQDVCDRKPNPLISRELLISRKNGIIQ
ncbi:MAG: hypothetical protein FWF68_04905 [Spirochaetes bacterium]|nr:hypothetical protein [Brevinematales bacterium]MCL1958920.1 hypothetical protein [Spirochaetota bacterium]